MKDSNKIAFSGNRRTRMRPPELVFAPERLLAGKSAAIRTREGDPEKQIQAFLHACGEDGTLERLHALCDAGEGLIGINFCFAEREYRYAIAAPVRGETAPDGDLERFSIQEGEFARFTPGGISCHNAWREIYNEWLPNAPYRYRVAQELEFYDESGPLSAQTLWVPIERQEQQLPPQGLRGGRFLPGEVICAALGAALGMLFTVDRGAPWLGALLGCAAGYLAFALFKRLRRK